MVKSAKYSMAKSVTKKSPMAKSVEKKKSPKPLSDMKRIEKERDDGYVVVRLHIEHVQKFMKESASEFRGYMANSKTLEERSNAVAGWILCALQDWKCLGKNSRNHEIPRKDSFWLCKVDVQDDGTRLWGVEHEDGLDLPSGFGWFELGFSMQWSETLNVCLKEAGIRDVHVCPTDELHTIGVYPGSP